MSDINNPGPPSESGQGDPASSPPPAYGQAPPPAYGQAPPPAYGQAPPPAYGQAPPPAYGQAPPPAYGQAPHGAAMAPQQEQTWAAAAHWSALAAGVLTSGLLAFGGPLLIMLLKGNDSPRVRRNAVESLNFQISILIYAVVSLVLWIVLIGILLSIAVGIAWLVLTILGAVKTNNGEDYRYPLTLRLVS